MPDIVAPIVDLEHPSGSRVRDYLLGGSAHWSVDREFGERVIDQFPLFRDIARANRMFANRVVRHLVKHGVQQFLDLGPGVLSAANTHQVADELDRNSRVVYVDDEPISVAHTEVLLDEEGDPDRHVIVRADRWQPEETWETARATGIFDLAEPVAVLVFAVLHRHRPEPNGTDAAARAMAGYRELLPVGSYLGISQGTDEGLPKELQAGLAELSRLCGTNREKLYCRSHAGIEALLGDFKIIDPGVVWTSQWHPEETGRCEQTIRFATPNHAGVRGGVGLKI